MRSASLLWFVAVCVIFVCIFEDVETTAKKSKEKKKKTKKARVCNVTASELDRKPFNVVCEQGDISSIAVIGHHGKKCQGLTPDLFVQMNSCYWKKNCTLTYSTNSTNFMLKLFKGKMADCVTKQPQYFTIKYECTTAKVKSLLIVREPVKRKKAKPKVVKAKQGVVLSHEDHPWLYQPYQKMYLREELTLRRPKKSHTDFFYTIRTLNLMWGDTLTVKSMVSNDSVFGHDYDLASGATFKVTGPSRVTFVLDTDLHTNGGEGFVICFKWSKPPRKGRKRRKVSDTCRKLIKTYGCGTNSYSKE